MSRDAIRALAAAAAAKRLVAAVGESLGRVGVPVAVLKGAALVPTVYAQPSAPARMLTDVDMLVSPGHRAQARAALEAAGFRAVFASEAGRSVDFAHPEHALRVDLHATLAHHGRFALDTDGVLARARPRADLFGAPALLPVGVDLFAHAVMHAISSRIPARDPRAAREMERIAAYFSLAPERIAAHLERHGLGRALRLVASWPSAGPVTSAAAQALPTDPLARLMVSIARASFDAPEAVRARVAPILGHAIDASTPASLVSVARHLGDVLSRRR